VGRCPRRAADAALADKKDRIIDGMDDGFLITITS
jgi:hypothetical protein